MPDTTASPTDDDEPLHPTPIGSHGVIGDLRSLALVGEDATIEWLCWPRFDAPSIFGRVLDPDGGSWSIRPRSDLGAQHQLYHPNTNVLISRFHHDDGIVEVEDLMDVVSEHRALVRRVRCIRGQATMRSVIRFRPDYGRATVRLEAFESGVSVSGGGVDLFLTAPGEPSIDGDEIVCDFELAEGETATFQLGDDIRELLPDVVEENIEFWQSWAEGITYVGRWRETVIRSALVLKLLTHADSGGLLAAGTTSLPEAVGGERNWDYRYVWIRDAAFTLYAFIELGLTQEADDFAAWLDARLCAGSDGDEPPLRPLYDLDGNADLDEETLPHWSGYRQSTPVRIGNAASDQLQLDIFGELIDSMYLADKHGPGLSLEAWDNLCELIDFVCQNWDRPDDGMWEVRSGPQRFTSSALMCWVALERGIRMADKRGRPAPIEQWRRMRDEIHAAILEHGWSTEIGAFTQTFDGDTVDASILLMPLVKFVSGTDPMWISTLDVVIEQLCHGVLVDRYDNDAHDDGLSGDDGSFGICSFWLVEAMTRAGRVSEARTMFEKLLTYAGPLGIFSEVIGPDGRQLGNYPQAFTHLALISAAVHLEEAIERGAVG